MSKQFDDTNRFTLFKSDKKVEAIQQGESNAESWADYNGSINVGGHDYWLNAWIKTSKNGRKFMSGTVKLKDGGPPRKPGDPIKRSIADDLDDEIPGF